VEVIEVIEVVEVVEVVEVRGRSRRIILKRRK
jgi:hypothetical protein